MTEFMFVLSILITLMLPFLLIAFLLFIFFPMLRREMLNDWREE